MWFLLIAAASAGEWDCRACCSQQGVDECELSLRVFGPESRLSHDGGGWRVDGTYLISCEGRGWFDNSRVVYLMDRPTDGEVAMPESEPGAIDCFVRSCALPRDLQVSPSDDNGRRFVTLGSTGVPPDRLDYRRAPGSSVSTTATATGQTATVVVLEGQTLYAQRTPTSPVDPVPSPATGTTPTAANPAVGNPAVAVTRPPVASPSGTTPAATPTAAVAPGPDPFAGPFPTDPPTRCEPADGGRGSEARNKVLAGDEQRIRGDTALAVAAYRAALTLDRCSGYGWLGFGQSALALDRPDIAVRALRNATRLLPAHYGAWAELGRAYEAIGQVGLAHSAFEVALELKPDLVDANAGWRRTMGR